MFAINYNKLHELESAFVIYEIATHGVDPREQLEGTTFRIHRLEGYKQQIYKENHDKLKKGGPYVDTVNDALKNNLVDYHQKLKIAKLFESDDRDMYEAALSSLYDGTDDEAAFKDIVGAFGGNFDVIGVLYFIKDGERYLPIRSGIFDARFKLLDVDAGLAGNCSWEKYQEYNETIKAVQNDLNTYVNKDITFLDAHSFVWILNGIYEYMNKVKQPVEHKKFGKGVIIDSDDSSITVKFANNKSPIKLLKSIAIDEGKLKFINPNFEIDDQIEEKKTIEANEGFNNYIVFQGGHYDEEYACGYLFAPYFDNGGSAPHHWERMTELRPGDRVFHYSKGYIRAISIVTSSWVDATRPKELGEDSEWGWEGRRVECDPYILDDPIKVSDFASDIIKYRNDKYSGFNKNGGANQGYLFELEPELASLFEQTADLITISPKTDSVVPIVGTFSSWTVKSEIIAIKQCDKSFFEYRGSTIPRNVYWFFGAEKLAAGEKKDIRLTYNNEQYDAYLQREIHELGRIRIFWEQSLADEFDDFNTPATYPKLLFEKLDDSSYLVSFDSERSSIESEIEELLSETGAETAVKTETDYAEIQKTEARKEEYRQEQRDNEYPRRYAKDIGISVDDWLLLLSDRDVFREEDIELVKKIYLEDNHATTLYDLSIKEGISPNSYTFPVVYLGKRISKAMQLDPIYRDDGTRAWWRIPFWGNKRADGHFEWKLRPELAKALAKAYPELDAVLINEEEDNQLVSDLKQSMMVDAPTTFEYVGGEKEKAAPIFLQGHKTYPRDRQTAINALAHADFKCEYDNEHPTFIRKRSDKPYTEPHHLVPMSFSDNFDVSLDREENIVSLCSNCHNEIHYGRDAKNLIIKLYSDRKELLSSVGINISLEDLLSMYDIK